MIQVSKFPIEGDAKVIRRRFLLSFVLNDIRNIEVVRKIELNIFVDDLSPSKAKGDIIAKLSLES